MEAPLANCGVGSSIGVMIWFYERGTETLRIETRFNNEARAYELIWHYPDGRRTLESFPDEAQFRARSQEVESSLIGEDGGPPAPHRCCATDGSWVSRRHSRETQTLRERNIDVTAV